MANLAEMNPSILQSMANQLPQAPHRGLDQQELTRALIRQQQQQQQQGSKVCTFGRSCMPSWPAISFYLSVLPCKHGLCYVQVPQVTCSFPSPPEHRQPVISAECLIRSVSAVYRYLDLATWIIGTALRTSHHPRTPKNVVKDHHAHKTSFAIV